MADKTPDPSLRQLDVLVGTWKVTTTDADGKTEEGTVSFAWLEGGFFLVQKIDLGDTDAVEYIGHDAETGTLKSHLFGNSPEILEYTWQVEGDTLTIWYGGTDSPARYTGRFNEDRTANTGAWEWPGGGYRSTMVRA
ncbi:hypothetical protein [Actinomadura macrotermitis]|uniref:DUF1579 domain-containing protein n=1 Tax=Actinomadura macrotermitis TaxID=2585200 RepID=A0A7K0BZR4_9ACTN|nr:hypothetical protein [Actinomadura macrotermitis]MQY06698.1 hypothetical protein [Actinomadura macrotermitis]